MGHHEKQPAIIFTKRRAVLGFISYVVLAVIVTILFVGR